MNRSIVSSINSNFARYYAQGITIFFLACAALTAQADQLRALDPARSTLSFQSSFQGNEIDGRFTKISGELHCNDRGTPESLTLYIALGSATTDSEERDFTLAGEDFFNVAKFPQARFDSSKIKLQDSAISIEGTLNLKGMQEQTRVDAEIVSDDDITLTGSTVVDRTLFHVGIGEFADTVALPKDIKVNFILVFSKTSAKNPAQ